jgi:hypothetical protein
VEVDDEGTFRLKFWKKNEKLKGDVLPLDGTANVSQGFLLEANFTLPNSDTPSDWPGFLIETKVPGALFVGMGPDGIASVGAYKSTKASDDFNYTAAAGPQTVPTHAEDATDWEFDGGAATR